MISFWYYLETYLRPSTGGNSSTTPLLSRRPSASVSSTYRDNTDWGEGQGVSTQNTSFFFLCFFVHFSAKISTICLPLRLYLII